MACQLHGPPTTPSSTGFGHTLPVRQPDCQETWQNKIFMKIQPFKSSDLKAATYKNWYVLLLGVSEICAIQMALGAVFVDSYTHAFVDELQDTESDSPSCPRASCRY